MDQNIRNTRWYRHVHSTFLVKEKGKEGGSGGREDVNSLSSSPSPSESPCECWKSKSFTRIASSLNH